MHVFVVAEGPSVQHKQFVEWIKSRKYLIEGKYRKGYHTPHVSEIKFYDIRIKEKAVDEFMKDLHTNVSIVNLNHDNMKKHFNWVVRLFDWLLRKLLGWKKLEPKEKKDKSEFKGWFYVKIIGAVEDPVNNEGKEWM